MVLLDFSMARHGEETQKMATVVKVCLLEWPVVKTAGSYGACSYASVATPKICQDL